MKSGFWYRLSHFVMRRPAPIAVISAAILIGLGSPLLGIRFTPATAQVLPTGQSARTVADVLNRSFPGNRADPIDIVLGSPPDAPQTAALRARIARLPNVAGITSPAPAGAENTILYAFTQRGPLTPESEQLVRAIRELRPPFYLGVAGTTASFLDLESSLGNHLPLVLALVVGATLVLLFLMTGSVVLPLKAIAMNALTLSAMLGILVWIFQDGHLQGLLSFSGEGALDATMPVFLAAVGFGLATDYGVFLLGRIMEARTMPAWTTGDAVAAGLERDRTHRHRRRAAVCRRDRRVRDVEHRLHQGARPRRGARRADRRHHNPGAAGACVDDSARSHQLVGSEITASAPQPVRPVERTTRLRPLPWRLNSRAPQDPGIEARRQAAPRPGRQRHPRRAASE